MTLVTRYSRDFSGNLVLDPEGSWVLAADAAIRDKKVMDKLAAETLRADTAEAELERFRRSRNSMLTNVMKERDAAEQRVSELTSKGSLESVARTLAACMDYPWQHMPENGRVLMRKHARDIIDAALNPKPEAGSHE